MIIKQYIKDFENLGFGLFVHFGLYSVIEKGEWVKFTDQIPDEEYYKNAQTFCPANDWAEQLVKTAKKAGCKYITLTTRHHDGFSLYDTCGLNKLDTVHTCGRDLVREFVNACRAEDIIPFFYHTILDWYDTRYKTDFSAYLQYLRDSVEILCKNYGKIGGLWFDGMWDEDHTDWEEDALYATIRKYQPEAMIINNTGLSNLGALGHIELDSVTFERGKPQPINMEGAPKYIASEMCEVLNDHWGYASKDLNYKSPARIIKELTECRRYGANMLLNVGPMGNGYLRPIDAAILELVGTWVDYNNDAIRTPRPTGIDIVQKPDDFLLCDGDTYYLFCNDLSPYFNPNVTLWMETLHEDTFTFNRPVKHVTWLDSGEEVPFEQTKDTLTIHTDAYKYGENMVVRVAKIEC